MIVNLHKSDGKIILAVCDKELIGKKFVEKNMQLDLTSNFYKGKEMSDEELGVLINKAYIVNLVGKKSVDFGIKKGIVAEKHIITVKNIPHAQAVIVGE